MDNKKLIKSYFQKIQELLLETYNTNFIKKFFDSYKEVSALGHFRYLDWIVELRIEHKLK